MLEAPHRLLLLRHGRPAESRPGVDDHDRPLLPGSESELEAVARHIERLRQPVDLVVASTAVRVRATVTGVLSYLPKAVETQWLRGLYLADIEKLLAELRELPAGVRTVLVCGHNPGLHQLALTLLDGEEMPPVLRREFPPAALAVIDVDAEWPDLGTGSGRLVSFTVPPTA